MTIPVHELLEAHRAEVIKMVDKIVMWKGGLVASDFKAIHERLRSRSSLIKTKHSIYAGRWLFIIEIRNERAIVHIPMLKE